VLVIDKNVENLTRIADRHYIIERGRTVWSGTSEELIAEPEMQHRYLGIQARAGATVCRHPATAHVCQPC
jgi:ABC-type lipopolysaccharide export system ATPase subunit